eukprot:TRINITY_DN5235_c0_g1_i1.p1 TRINITY_DN5235_c0_g1~~TRINITY_DN5235_c0_g1_i1.p1  ORF type:complete len:310 (+),score=39.15 TRINITY_DN5235_c0_g1_i1:62-931(+)
MESALGESIIVSSNRTSGNERPSQRRRYVIWGLLTLPFLVLLVVTPGIMKSRLASLESSPVRSSKAPSSALIASANRSVPRAPVLAIIADYDNCWDSLSQTNPALKHGGLVTRARYNAAMRFIDAVKSIAAGRERIILFVGSERQSLGMDKILASRFGNGLALGPDGAFEKWAKTNKQHGWELNKALLADGSEPFSAWNNVSKTFETGTHKEVKRRIVENSLRQLQDLELVDVYFFESHEKNLDYIRERVVVPRNIHFFTVFYDEYMFSSLHFNPIKAKDRHGRSWTLQ